MNSLRNIYLLALAICSLGLLAVLVLSSNKFFDFGSFSLNSDAPSPPHASTSPHHKATPQSSQDAPTENFSPQSTRSPKHAIPNQRLLSFASEDDYQKFLNSLHQRGLVLRGRSNGLRTALVEFNDRNQLDGIDGAELGYNFPVNIPGQPTGASAQASAVAFGQSTLDFLGIQGDHSQWGKGITVAVLDSGVTNHLALSGEGALTQISILDLPDGAEQFSHGTAVASLISGDHPALSGVAPASDLLSIQVTNENGTSDSFTLAEGIVRAADAGAQVINISLGSPGDSAIVRDAVQYARDSGAVIVASSGNEGLGSVSFPAGYADVIAVGAVEAQGEILDFSNTGDAIELVAPGFGIVAAWGDDEVTSFSGTSASAPLVSGAIAAALSENPDLSTQQAADLVLSNLNEAGTPGTDPAYGSGILDVGRVINANTPGIFDPAVVSQVLVPSTANSTNPQLWVTVQNQGTEPLTDNALSINSLRGTQDIIISSLPVGATQTFSVPIALPQDRTATSVTSTIQNNSGNNEDFDLNNSTRTDTFGTEE